MPHSDSVVRPNHSWRPKRIGARMNVFLNLSPLGWSGLCALGGAACLALAVRNIFAWEAARGGAASGTPPRAAAFIDLPASGAGLLALAGLFFVWPEAVANNHRSALYAMLCYSFWFWPDWARHILDPHVKHFSTGARLRLNLALFSLAGLLTLLALVLLTQILVWPGAVVAVMVGLTLATVTSLGLFYAWLSALLLPVPATVEAVEEAQGGEEPAIDRAESARAHLRERRWFWRALMARVAALLLFAIGAWTLWQFNSADQWNWNLVVAGGFVLALAAYVFVIWVDLGNDAERREARAASLPQFPPASAVHQNGVGESAAGSGEGVILPKTLP